ncbi:MAG: sigma-70 family RNA polymerase sigma factor [Candidatus Brocadiae bacterium]|nr:sigma-70 family RNA polymerase sigma factor [Candidatus Brocadiia bacterium]
MADRDTIFRLLMQHEGEIRAFVGSMLRDRSLSDDVFQEVTLTLWEQADRYDASRPFCPWARGIAAHKVLERRRRDRRFPLAFSPETIEAVAQAFSRTETGSRHELDALERCFQRLPERSRRLLALRYEGDLSVGEIARRTGRTLDAIYQALSRARAALEECIRRRLAAEQEGA